MPAVQTHTTAAPSAIRSGPAPLWAVLAFTFLNSVGTGVVTTGIPFLATSAYDFGAWQNYGLGLILGVTYIAGALAAGPALRRLVARLPWLSTRAALAALMVALAALCTMPLLARTLAGTEDPRAGSWAVWALIAIYSPLTGVLWPIVEAFLSGGRSAHRLRSSIGIFNVVWSSALVAAYFLMAPLLKLHPLEIIAGLALIHVGSMALLRPMGPEPARHLDDAHEPHPPVYADLLRVFRLQLPLSYLFFSALTPYLPTVLTQLGVDLSWQTPIAAAWLISRVITFLVLQRWHGWQGRWGMALAGGALLLAGFSGSVLAARLGGPGAPGLTVLIASLAVFGVGMGTIYKAALYYAMEVGGSEVDAGGIHEALIGVGYTAGPLCGLGAAWAVSADLIRPASFEPAVIVAVAALSLPVVVYSTAKALRPRPSRA